MSSPYTTRRHIVVIVLGDVGRSPRMQYHARSLLEQGHYVTLVGYEGEELIPDLQPGNGKWSAENQDKSKSKSVCSVDCTEDNLLHIVRFDPYSPPIWLKKYKILQGKFPIGLPLYLLLRLAGLLFGLTYALWYRASKRKKKHFPVDCILVQNPPSIPLLLISYLYCIAHTRISTRGQKNYINFCRPGLVIDWHNLGYTMFDTSPNHPIKQIAKYYEKRLAPLSDGNLCVTASMREFLIMNFNVKKENISVLHDRPPEFFHPTSLENKHQLMMKLRDEMELSCPELKRMRLEKYGDDDETITLFTKSITCDGGTKKIIPQDNQPALLISSTSWTPDEDFSILLDALVHLNSKINENQKTDKISFPHLIVIVTGKGPQKDMYKSKIAKLELNHVSIITMWLEAKDYPLLLGCSDLGISLHISTSGFDLPMKIYDFYGCEVPVCAISFSCLYELVQDGVNGRVFDSGNQLSDQIYDIFHSNERDRSGKMDGELRTFRENIQGISRWRENWIENAYEIILAACPVNPNNSADVRRSFEKDGDKKKN